MKRVFKVLASLSLAAACVLSAAACAPEKKSSGPLVTGENGQLAVAKTGNGLHFYASDGGFADFLNDYYSRHVRENTDKSIGNVKLGQGWMFQKEWESKYLTWFDSTSRGIKGYDAMYNFSSGLDAVYVSDYGSVSVMTNIPFLKGSEVNGAAHGWPFNYGQRTGNYAADFLDSPEGWTINGRSDVGTFSDGYWNYTFTGTRNQSLVYEVDTLGESIRYAPMIEFAFKLQDLSDDGGYDANIEDILLSFRMQGDSDWTTLSYYEDAIFGEPISGRGMVRAWFPVYLHPAWSGTLDALRVEIVPKAGKSLELVSSCNYIRLETDTRLTNTNSWYINAMEEYVSFTGDAEMLRRNLEDLRKAMMFQIYALDGQSGILKTSYIPGKTTTQVEKDMFGQQGNSWYDVIVTGNVNFLANLNFYNTLLSMAKLEEYAAVLGIASEPASVKDPYPYREGAADIVWTQTPETLRALAEKVKTEVGKDVEEGGLWNPETGRFAWAIYDADSRGGEEGTASDYGYTEQNLMAVAYDFATPEQKESIMSWISGERAVAGDDSTGEDIYFYRYAPRLNTKDNKEDSTSIYQLSDFGGEIQNGGASMHVTYYDLLARNSYYGADNSFARYKEIQDWYEDVQEIGGKGAAFYRQYYAEMLALYGNAYRMTGGGGTGPVGLDEEFYEAALLYAAVPYTYFGLESTTYGTLLLRPDLPSALDYLAIENMMYHNVRYDLYVGADGIVVLSDVTAEDPSVKVRLELAAQAGSEVYVNGQKAEAVQTADGRLAVEIPLQNSTIEVR